MADSLLVEEKIIALIKDSHNSVDRNVCLHYLNKAKNLSHELINDNNPKGFDFLIEIISEYAKENYVPSERYNLWIDCLNKAFKGIEKFDDPMFVNILAKKAVDFIQDQFIYIPVATANHYLSAIKEKIDYFLCKKPHNDQYNLLSRKSSLLRNMSKYQTTRIAQVKMSQEAIRCAQKAVDAKTDSWDAYLELGLSFWHYSQYENEDEKYNCRIKSAEDLLWESATLEPTVYNLLAICRLYRLTYQTTPFFECFDLYAMKEYNKRRFLRNSYMYGEGVIQLWYARYPKEITNYRLDDSERLLEEAIDAGFNDARHLINLAFIKAAKGNIDVGIDILKKLHSSFINTSWNEIAQIITRIQTGDDLLAQGFALGIDSSSIWNKLGTFATTFLNDPSLSVLLYEEALRLNRANAVAMTNLSRAFLMKDNPESIREANMWISKAASCADRRFRWWRSVRDDVKKKMNLVVKQPTQTIKHENKKLRLKNLSDLYKSYQQLKESNNPQARGFALEKLVDRLFNISLGNSFSSYRTSLKWFTTPIMQIDGAFNFFNKDFYKRETKWTSTPITPNDIILFKEKLDVIGVKGLFISISGFTTEAIQKAYDIRKEYQILLMNGEELELILQGSISLDEAIRIKQVYFAKESNPYFKIEAIIQLENA